MTRFTRTAFLAAFLVITGMVFSTQALAKKPKGDIHVSGSAEVHVRPDILTFSLGIKTFGADVKAAYVSSDSIAQAITALASKYGVSKDYIQVGQFEILPERHYTEKVQGVGISRVVQILVKNPIPSEMDHLIMDAMMAGANTIIDFDYKTTELAKYRDEARTLAMKNAMNRARSLLVGTGGTLGDVVNVNEGRWSYYPYSQRYSNWWRGGDRSNELFTSQMVSSHVSEGEGDGGDGNASSIAMGLIVVRAEVSATFKIN